MLIHDQQRRRDNILLLYVDDLILVGNDLTEINHIKTALSGKFYMKDLMELRHFLGITIERDINNETLYLDQSAYPKAVLNRFEMSDCNGLRTPIEAKLNLAIGPAYFTSI